MMIKRLNGLRSDYFASLYDLDAIGDVDRDFYMANCWILHLPEQSPAWHNYHLSGFALTDSKKFGKANKKSEDMTHEVSLSAVDPDTPISTDGVCRLLQPHNYSEQFKMTDEQMPKLLEFLAVSFINGKLPAEPQGITGARAWLKQMCDEYLEELNNVKAIT